MLLWAHVACAVLSYAAFLTGFAAALAYLAQERQLKRKRMGWLFHRLPSLESLDRANLIAIVAGFLLFSGGLTLGAVMEHRTFGRWVSGDPKEILSALTWLSYASLLYVRVMAARGQRVAIYSVAGFSWLVFAFFAARFLFPTWHAFLF